MPLWWTIDSRERLYSVVAEGNVTFEEAGELLETLAESGAVSYRKMLDGRAATPVMTAEELLTVAAEIRRLHGTGGPVGALAVVATAEQTVAFSRLLGALASAQRPIRIFDTPRRAQRWLMGPAASPGGGSGSGGDAPGS